MQGCWQIMAALQREVGAVSLEIEVAGQRGKRIEEAERNLAGHVCQGVEKFRHHRSRA